MLAPAAVGVYFAYLDYLRQELTIAGAIGLVAAIASISWFIFRLGWIASAGAPTPELNADFKQRISGIRFQPELTNRRFYFRKWWTLVANPLFISIAYLLLSNEPITFHDLLTILIIGSVVDYFLFRSPLGVWYLRRNEKLTLIFLIVPLITVDINRCRAYKWKWRGMSGRAGTLTVLVDRLILIDGELRPTLTLPVGAFDFDQLKTEVISQCQEVPSSLSW